MLAWKNACLSLTNISYVAHVNTFYPVHVINVYIQWKTSDRCYSHDIHITCECDWSFYDSLHAASSNFINLKLLERQLHLVSICFHKNECIVHKGILYIQKLKIKANKFGSRSPPITNKYICHVDIFHKTLCDSAITETKKVEIWFIYCRGRLLWRRCESRQVICFFTYYHI